MDMDWIIFATASGAIATTGTQYVKIPGKITKFEKSEELDGVTMFDITVKPTRVAESGALVTPAYVTV
jgi:hypothetical protein